MRSRILSALAAIALIGGSTAVSAQAAQGAQAAPEPATESVSGAEGSALGSDQMIGAIFGLAVLALLIWLMDDDDDLAPVSP